MTATVRRTGIKAVLALMLAVGFLFANTGDAQAYAAKLDNFMNSSISAQNSNGQWFTMASHSNATYVFAVRSYQLYSVYYVDQGVCQNGPIGSAFTLRTGHNRLVQVRPWRC